MKFGAIMLEPIPRFLHIGHGFPDKPPETRSVVHFAQMRNFMSSYIVKDVVGRKNQAPRIAYRSGC